MTALTMFQHLRRSARCRVLCLVGASWVTLGTTVAAPVTLYYQSLVGEIDPFNIEIGGVIQNTGLVSLMLDLTNPAADQITFDIDTLTVESHVDLLLMAPLLSVLGLPPQRLHVDEVGPISVVGFASNGILQPNEAMLDGSGVFGPGQLLAGWTYSNSRHVRRTNQNDDIRTAPGGVIEFGPNGEKQKGTLKSPSGTQIDLNLSGRGALAPQPVPEPSSRPLLVLVLVIAFVYQRMREHHHAF